MQFVAQGWLRVSTVEGQRRSRAKVGGKLFPAVDLDLQLLARRPLADYFRARLVSAE